MNFRVRRSAFFREDFDRQFRWYLEHAGERVAVRFLAAVTHTVERLTRRPEIGRKRRFRHPELQGFHSLRVQPPFDAHLLFYRVIDSEISIERMLHGRRDLPQRLREPPGAGD
jgi:toxin ParE1/3/4